MKLLIVTPAPPRSRKGNRVTAVRWARLLRELGHHVEIAETFSNQSCDALIALHARKSATSVKRFAERHPDKPLILTLTGTDLYRDIHSNASAVKSLELATCFVLLQPHGIRTLPKRFQKKARVIYQSVTPPKSRPAPLESVFEVCVLGHLRPVKDPFRTALAARKLPASSRIRIVHCGGALTDSMRQRAETEIQRNARYKWLGELSHGQTMRRLARSRVLVLTSKLEGGANVVSEALAVGVPIISTRISGSIGLLGEVYPGFFEVGATDELARLLERVETDAEFYESLKSHCRRVSSIVDPSRERQNWHELLMELTSVSTSHNPKR